MVPAGRCLTAAGRLAGRRVRRRAAAPPGAPRGLAAAVPRRRLPPAVPAFGEGVGAEEEKEEAAAGSGRPGPRWAALAGPGFGSLGGGLLPHVFAADAAAAPGWQRPRRRPLSSLAGLLPSVPEFAQHWTVWGGSGHVLRALHHGGTVPYWACMGLTNGLVRTSLLPLVLQGAHTATRFANVAPEVQFLVTCFQRDMKGMKERDARPSEKYALMRTTMQTMGGLYKLHGIHPLSIFKAPLMQLPVFWYFSIDLRKIINGADPELAQGLTEGGLLWVTDLSEPDPYYGLPVLGGLLLYLNVEVALGKHALSGEASSRANAASFMKDGFQSLGVFMPCFMAHQPAGIQIYLATSFVFTMLQSAALRNDSFRSLVGLTPKDVKPPAPKTATEFMNLKKFEQEAKEERGEGGEVLGADGVLAPGWEASKVGRVRESTIAGSGGGDRLGNMMRSRASGDPARLRELWSPALRVPEELGRPTPLRAVAADEVQEPQSPSLAVGSGGAVEEQSPRSIEVKMNMEAANRGERPVAIIKEEEKTESVLKLGAFAKKKGRRKGQGRNVVKPKRK